MGLNCSHGAFDGSYGAFCNFRQGVAKALGGSYPPHNKLIIGCFCPDKSWYVPQKVCDCMTDKEYEGMSLFFCHDDCGGSFSPTECRKVVVFLEMILPKIETLNRQTVIDATKKFIDGCKLAASKRQSLLFR